jgi:hypothetical protein
VHISTGVAQTVCALITHTHTQTKANKGKLAVEMFLFVLVISFINMEKRSFQIGFSVSFSSSAWRALLNCNSAAQKDTYREREHSR